MANQTTYNNISLAGDINISYIAAGAATLPTLLLLHGFPSSSNQYRNLIPLLSPYYHILAPDFPGFGLTTVPSSYAYTFENLAATTAAFLAALGITSYAAYIFDYGAPVLFRLALRKPESVTAIVSQNGNAYVEGLGHPFWDIIEALWTPNATAAQRETVRDAYLNLAATKWQYTHGVPEKDLPRVDPAAWTLDYLENEGTKEKQDIQLDLFKSYGTNVEIYPQFQEYLRKSQVPLLAIWGKGDPIFVPPGAEAFKRDLPDAIVKFVDAGHFALETKVDEIAAELLEFLKKIKY